MLKSELIGYLGRDAEVKFSQDGRARLEYSVGCKTGYGEREKTEWVRCVIFGKRAESGLADYMTKGLKIYSDGKLSTNEWKNSEGETVFNLNLNVDDFHFCDKKGGGGTRQRGNNSYVNETVDEGLVPENDYVDDIPF